MWVKNYFLFTIYLILLFSLFDAYHNKKGRTLV
ncbi:hypothetical protein LTSEADE_4516, partial [Salmonella enterica subsp. enterica serovar Adelaide str. A4-669]